MSKELKVSSFRVSEEVKDKLKDMIKAEGWGNQDVALSTLISAYETEQSKIAIPERKTEIESLQSHLQAISDIYRHSLQINQDAEERIKQGYANTLESNQKTILKLQNENESLSASMEKLKEELKTIKGELSLSEKDCIQALKQSETAEKLINEYKIKNDNLNGLLGEYKGYKDENKKLCTQITILEKNNNNLAKEIEEIKQQSKSDLSDLSQKNKSDLADLKQQGKEELFNIKEKFSQEKEILVEKNRKIVDDLTAKRNQEKEESNQEYKKLLDELDMLRKENLELLKQIPVPDSVNETVAAVETKVKTEEAEALVKKRATRKTAKTKEETSQNLTL